MHNAIEIRTLILTITVILMCRAAIMGYVWIIAKRYTPVGLWASGSTMIATGALFIGLRDILLPLSSSVLIGQSLLIFGWLVLDSGTVLAADRRPPWRLGIAVALMAIGGVFWFLVVKPDFALRTIATSMPGILFDAYAAVACAKTRMGRRSNTLRILAVLLLLLASSNALKMTFIVQNNVQALFASDWQIGQFYLTSVVAIVIGTVLFVLLAIQRLQDELDTEIDERKRTEGNLKNALAESERFRLALDNVPSYVYMKDLNSRYIYANKPSLDLFNCSREDLANSDDYRFFPPATAERLRAIDRKVFSGANSREEIDIPDAHGGRRVYLEVKTPVYSDMDKRQVTGLCGISTDITGLKEHEKQLEFIAHNDALTKLPNRVLLSDRLAQALAQAERRGKTVAVIFLDLDGFKEVNDNYGHETGDALLVEVSQRLMRVLRNGDTLARFGGDEFVAVLIDLEQSQDYQPIVARLLEAASEPIKLGEQSLAISASIGIALYPEDNLVPDQLLRDADQAMYQAKKEGKNCYRRFSKEMYADQ